MVTVFVFALFKIKVDFLENIKFWETRTIWEKSVSYVRDLQLDHPQVIH